MCAGGFENVSHALRSEVDCAMQFHFVCNQESKGLLLRLDWLKIQLRLFVSDWLRDRRKPIMLQKEFFGPLVLIQKNDPELQAQTCSVQIFGVHARGLPTKLAVLVYESSFPQRTDAFPANGRAGR